MLNTYGFSICGQAHIKTGKVCQDSHKISCVNDTTIVAAIADGVGSAMYSDIGSRIAVETVVDFCTENIDQEDTLQTIEEAFSTAFLQIQKKSDEDGNPINEYDTTLSMVIYKDNHIWYGHSGDGGIIGLTTEGKYVAITTPQKGADMVSVIPLRAGADYWDIGESTLDFASIILVTDGMLDALTPYLLRQSNEYIYIPFVMLFADNHCYNRDAHYMNKTINELVNKNMSDRTFDDCIAKGLECKFSSYDKISSEISSYRYPLQLMDSVSDDITIVGIIDMGANIKTQSKEYYREPDWNSLQILWESKAYPHLYQE